MADVEIDVEKWLAAPRAAETLEMVREKLEADEEISAMMKVVNSIEGVYEIVKKCVYIQYEKFKELCEGMMAHFKDDKVALDDATLDNVTGGWSLSKFWNNVVCATVWGACAIAGAVGGVAATVIGGPAVIAGFLGGATIGYGIGLCITEAIGLQWQE